VLDAIGDKAAYVGPIGSATVAKLVHNMSGYAIVCALAETFTLGRLCNLTLAEMTEALARGWGARDSRVVMLLQQERAGVEIAVDRERLREVLAPTVGKGP
jgi:3-hydroxyisobutyrate dehydrogenase-like beta-hydroxyacid dehydrogenase